MAKYTSVAINGQMYTLTCGLGLQTYIEARTLAGDLTEAGFADPMWGMATCDILTIATETTYSEVDWYYVFANTTDDVRTEMVLAATAAITLSTPTPPGTAVTPPEMITTDFSAPGMPAVGTPAWHQMVRGG